MEIEARDEGLLLKPVHGEPNVTNKEGVFSCTSAGYIVQAVQKQREDLKRVWPEGSDRLHVP